MASTSALVYRELLAPAVHRRTAAGGLVSRVPQAVLGFSALLLVQQQTGSFSAAGVVSSAVVATSAASTPVIGRLADRHGQRAVLHGCAGLNGLAVALFVVCATGGAATAVLVAAAAAVGLTTLPVGALTRARWSGAVGDRPRHLASAYALEGVLDELVWVGGPAAAAVVAAAAGATWALALGCATGVVGALVLAAQPVVRTGGVSAGEAAASTTSRRPRACLGLPVVSAPVVAVLLGMLATGVVFGAADISAVALSTELGRPELAGVALGAGSLGAVVGGVLVGALPPGDPSRAVVVTAGLVALGWAPLALATSFGAVVVLCFLGGCAFAPFSVTANRLVEAVSPPHRLTEALAWLATAVVAGMALGSVVAGFLIDRGGAGSGYLLVAAAAPVPLLVTSAAALAARQRHSARAPAARAVHPPPSTPPPTPPSTPPST